MKISNPRLLAGNAALATQNYVSGLLDYKLSSYVLSTFLFENDQIKPKLLPPISITSVTTINLSDITGWNGFKADKNPEENLIGYLAAINRTIQSGDVIVITSDDTTIYDDYSAYVGAWIYSEPTFENPEAEKTLIKLTFPTASIKTVNGFSPDESGNIYIPISSYNEFVTVSSQVITNKNDITTLSADINYVSNIISGEISGAISANTDAIEAINIKLNNFNAFYVNSLTFDLLSGTRSISAQPTKEVIDINITETTAADSEFDTDLTLYTIQTELPKNSEIIETYLVSGGIAENFYPDIKISDNLYQIDILADKNEMNNVQVKLVYSNYKLAF